MDSEETTLPEIDSRPTDPAPPWFDDEDLTHIGSVDVGSLLEELG